MTKQCTHLGAIVFDWAGTTVDCGSRGPAAVFQRVFASRGIEVTIAQAREPMGMAKREHIAAVAAMPPVAAAWSAKFGSPCGEQDIDALYAEFLPLQKAILSNYSDVIQGVPQAVNQCREMGLRIGSSTGYTRELMQIVTDIASQQGYQPDLVLCAEDAPRGRPAPYLLFEAAKRLDVYPMWRFIKVDDTQVGIEAGRNAGCWTVGVTRTGNCVGLSEEELSAMSDQEVQRLCKSAAERLTAAGAHYLVESVAEIPAIVTEIEGRLAIGEKPDG
jgi:phosphonoacetaldehyde hydrolase